ncbi:MAG: hypothetical protein ABJB09_07650 [Verrucomicrobiota bacterium]
MRRLGNAVTRTANKNFHAWQKFIACHSEQMGKRNYQPLYAFAGGMKFRSATTLVAQN